MHLPLFTNNSYRNLDDALQCPLGNFTLARHSHFDYFFNKEYHQIEYDSTLYQNSVEGSKEFQSHLLHVASYIKGFAAPSDKVVEVGCGKGDFFNILSQQGFQSLHGFDKIYEGGDSRIHKRYFSEHDADFNADIIVLRHTLEHIPQPFKFLLNILKINSSKKASLVIEVPSFDWIASHQAWWELGYEHCNYFTRDSFKTIFPNADVRTAFHNQYLLAKLDYNDIQEDVINLPDDFEEVSVDSLFPFFSGSLHAIDNWKKLFSSKRYWIWGCASKGVLALFHMKQFISEYVSPIGCIDINPLKQSNFLPSLGYKVMSPSYLYDHLQNGDIVIVSNPNYLQEVRAMISGNTIKSFEIVSL